MPKWELATYSVSLSMGGLGGNDPAALWTRKQRNGKIGWDVVRSMADEGWELVAVTPIQTTVSTAYLLYTFKRPMTPKPLRPNKRTK